MTAEEFMGSSSLPRVLSGRAHQEVPRVAEPDGVPQEAWIRLGAVQEIVRTPNSPYFTATAVCPRGMQDSGSKCYLCHMPYNVRPLSGMGPLLRVWEAQMAESAAGDALFERTGKVSFVQVLPHALQHVLAAFAGIVTPAIIIASVCGFTPQEEAAVIQASLVLSALDIFLQQFPIKGVVGSGLPIVMGASFTFVPALKAVGLELGLRPCWRQAIGGALVVLFGLLFRRVSFLFPAPVLGTVIFVIGLSLCPVAVAPWRAGRARPILAVSPTGPSRS